MVPLLENHFANRVLHRGHTIPQLIGLSNLMPPSKYFESGPFIFAAAPEGLVLRKTQRYKVPAVIDVRPLSKYFNLSLKNPLNRLPAPVTWRTLSIIFDAIIEQH